MRPIGARPRAACIKKRVTDICCSVWPFSSVSNKLELRRLRKKLPRSYRGFVRTSGGMRPETDLEYLDRLRIIYQERSHRLINTPDGNQD
jgi:hypothetical protein